MSSLEGKMLPFIRSSTIDLVTQLVDALWSLTLLLVCLFQGLILSRTISHTVSTVMNMHVYQSRAMTKSVVLILCSLIELLKVCYLYHTYHSLVCMCEVYPKCYRY